MQLPRTQQKQQARSLADNRPALDQIAGKLTPPEIDPPMEKGVDSTHPDFWTSRYATGKTPWDFGGVPAALRSFLVRSSAPGKVLIPGYGSGYEVQAFHEAGYDVTAIDFSPAAVNQTNRVLGVLAGRVIFGDFLHAQLRTGRFRPHLRTDISLFHASIPLARLCEQDGRLIITGREIGWDLFVWATGRWSARCSSRWIGKLL